MQNHLVNFFIDWQKEINQLVDLQEKETNNCVLGFFAVAWYQKYGGQK
jgi:hypothetical protein